MRDRELTGMDVYFWVQDVPGRGFSLVGIEGTSEGGRVVKVDAGAVNETLARAMVPRLRSVVRRSGRSTYLVRFHFAEMVTVITAAQEQVV